jgi:hypothetical protein
MASFCNETTVEIAIAAQLRDVLGQGKRRVVPVHFWASREGSRTASRVHADVPLRLIALFARRPKSSAAPHVVEGKINWELQRFAGVAKTVGIPTFAVFPCVNNLLDLSDTPPLLFLDIQGEGGDVFFSVQLGESVNLLTSAVRPLVVTPDAMIDRAYQMQKPATLEWWSQAIRDVRAHSTESGSWIPWGRATYKPLYLLLSDLG